MRCGGGRRRIALVVGGARLDDVDVAKRVGGEVHLRERVAHRRCLVVAALDDDDAEALGDLGHLARIPERETPEALDFRLWVGEINFISS